jgi:hypothetical protein
MWTGIFAFLSHQKKKKILKSKILKNARRAQKAKKKKNEKIETSVSYAANSKFSSSQKTEREREQWEGAC